MRVDLRFLLLPVYALATLQPLAMSQSAAPSKEAHARPSPYAREAAAGSSRTSEEEASLRAAIVQKPASPDPWYRLALLLRMEGKARESLDAYTQAARLRKPAADELRSVALDYVLLNDYEDAIRWLEMAARMEPANAEVLYSLGRCYYSKDRYADAASTYERVLTIAPKHVKAEENLGLAYDAMNQTEKAETALRLAASWADPQGQDEWPFLDLGSFLLDHAQSQAASESLRTAVAIGATNAAAHEKLGRALLATHDLQGGLNELQRAAALDGSNPKIHFELGRALRQAGQIDRAQQEFDISQKLYSTHSQE